MKKKEFFIVTAFFLLLAVSFAGIRWMNWPLDQGDSAFLFDLTENIAFTGKPESGVSGAIANYLFDKHYTTMPAEQFAADSLQMPETYKVNFFNYHTYLFLYVLAPFVWLVPTDVLLKVFTVLCFIGMPYLLYGYLRKREVPILAAVSFCILIVSHPAWSQALQGQLYVDRFFMLFGLLFAILFTSEKPNKYLILVSALLALSFTERTGLIAGIFAVGYVTLHWRKINALKYFRLTIGLSMLVISTLLKKLFTSYTAYDNFLPHSFHDLAARLQDTAFVEKTGIFLIFNLLLMAVFLIFNWRLALLAIVVMMPNVVGSIGGAEKIGWLTHYHSNYYPFLVFAAAAGFASMNVRWRLGGRSKQLWLTAILPLAVASCISLINPYEFQSVNVAVKNLYFNPIYKHYKDIKLFYTGGYGKAMAGFKAQIQGAVPEHSVVTMPEGTMSLLYQNRRVQFFPVGIEQADYAVLTILGKDAATGAYTYGGAVSYLGPEAAGKINESILERMERAGYDFEHPVLVDAVGIAIVKRAEP